VHVKQLNGWFYAVLCVIAVLPFVIFDHPPIVDFPAHSARLFVECHRAGFADMYSIHFGIIPDLAIDLIGSTLCGVVPGQTVVLYSLASAQLAICGFVWLVRRRLFGGNDALVLIVPAFAMNLVTTMGYANYLIGIAVGFGLLYALVRWPDIRPVRLFAMTSIAGIITFFCHIFALMFMMVVVCGWLWSHRLSDPPIRRLIRAGFTTIGLFAAPLVLMTLISSDEPMKMGSLNKVRSLAAVTMSGTGQFDFWIMLIWLLSLIYLLATRGVTTAKPIRGALMLGVLGCLCLPSTLGAAVDIDARFTVAVAFLLAAGASLRNGAGKTLILALALVTLGIHSLVAIQDWRRFDGQVAEWRAATSILRPGQGLLTVDAADPPPPSTPGGKLSSWHLASYATIDRHIFDPQGFTGRGMQPMEVTDRYRYLDAPGRMRLDPDMAREAMMNTPPSLRAILAKRRSLAFADWGHRYIYVAYFHYGAINNFDPQRLDVVAKGSFFSILTPKKTDLPMR
jgi:hypothetical protein